MNDDIPNLIEIKANDETFFSLCPEGKLLTFKEELCERVADSLVVGEKAEMHVILANVIVEAIRVKRDDFLEYINNYSVIGGTNTNMGGYVSINGEPYEEDDEYEQAYYRMKEVDAGEWLDSIEDEEEPC